MTGNEKTVRSIPDPEAMVLEGTTFDVEDEAAGIRGYPMAVAIELTDSWNAAATGML